MTEASTANAPGLRRSDGVPYGRLAASTLVIGAAIGTYGPFAAIILVGRGLSVADVGVVTALGALAYVVGVPIIGRVADIAVGRVRMLAIAGLAGGLFLGAIGLVGSSLAIGVLFVAGTVCFSAWMALNDAIVVNALPDPSRYGRVRLLASFSYAVVAAGAGVIYAATGYSAALGAVALGGIAVTFVAIRLPDVGRAARGRVARSSVRDVVRAVIDSAATAVRAAPELPGFLLAIALVSLGYAAGNTFLGLRIIELGGGSVDVATAASVSAVVEVPGMIVAGAIASRFGLRALFLVTAGILAAVTLSWALAGSVGAVLVSRVVVGAGYAGLTVTGVLTMRAILPARLQGTGQSLFQATIFGFAGVIVNAAGGFLHGPIGYAGLFAGCAILGVGGMLIGARVYARSTTLRPAAAAAGGRLEP